MHLQVIIPLKGRESDFLKMVLENWVGAEYQNKLVGGSDVSVVVKHKI